MGGRTSVFTGGRVLTMLLISLVNVWNNELILCLF